VRLTSCRGAKATCLGDLLSLGSTCFHALLRSCPDRRFERRQEEFHDWPNESLIKPPLMTRKLFHGLTLNFIPCTVLLAVLIVSGAVNQPRVVGELEADSLSYSSCLIRRGFDELLAYCLMR
jgi:hypothetical protein